ncbi:NAD(P)-binding protein [Astrocystis sublimbata]|nr:NAD(P)-binding protein [Astrocystis sublimbata]
MSILKKVAIVGASGNLGPNVLQQVVKAGFEVTVLTRKSGSHAYPASVKEAEVDYDSMDSLVAALKGQDAVVSTIASAALSRQLLLVEAAAKAGVKRFLPSEFGSDTTNAKSAQLPSYGDKVTVQKALKEQAAQSGGMTYTLVMNGPFFDWGMRVGFVADIKGKSITLWDGGNRVFSTSTLATVGRAVAGVLNHPAETENRTVYVQDTAVSSAQLLETAKRATGSSGWKGKEVSLDDHVNAGWEELNKPQPNPANFVMNFITAAVWGEGYGAKFEKLDNDLLGIKQMSESDIAELIRDLSK